MIVVGATLAALVMLKVAQPLTLFALLAVIFTLPLYQNGLLWGVWDWTEVTAHYASARHSFAAGQWPLWNPYFCGGNPLWGSPQAYWPSLSFLLTVPFGDVIGTKMAITIYVWLGLWGAWLLARAFKIGQSGALFAAIIYIFSGYLSAKIAAGQMNMLTIVWTPWVLYFLMRSFTRPWLVVPAALFSLLIFFEGMMYMVVSTGIAVLVMTATYLIWGDNRRAVVRSLLLYVLITPLLGAVKLLPTLEFSGWHYKSIRPDKRNTVASIAGCITGAGCVAILYTAVANGDVA